MANVNGIAELNKKLANPGVTLSRSELRTALDNWRSDFAAALPAHLKANASKYAQQALRLFSSNPALQACSGVTILSGLMTANQLGLDLNPVLGQCYLIPRRHGKTSEATFQIGYRGALTLAYRSGLVVKVCARVVHERDEFSYTLGSREILIHKPCDDPDSGEITHVYATAELKSGAVAFEVWSIDKINAFAKKFSESYLTRDRMTGQQIVNAASPWSKHFEAMAKKTVVLALLKYLPMSTELAIASELDGSIRRTLEGITDERDVITLAAAEPDDEPPAIEPASDERENEKKNDN